MEWDFGGDVAVGEGNRDRKAGGYIGTGFRFLFDVACDEGVEAAGGNVEMEDEALIQAGSDGAFGVLR